MPRKGTFRCAKCGRTFALAMHLGRHMTTMHATKKSPAAKAKPKYGAALMRASRPIAGNGIAGLRQEIQAARDAMAAQLAALDDALAAFGGAPAPARVSHNGRRRRPARTGTLPACIQQVLRAHRSAMPVQAITAAVLKAGFKTRDKTLAHTVGKYLARMPGAVRVARGVYRLK